MSKYKIISPIVIIAVLFSAASITTAWTGPTANPTGNNVPAPINVGASTQTKSGLLNASGLNATSFFSYKGYLGGATNPPALNKILVSLDSNGIASWKSLQQIVQEVCSAPGSCPFLGGDSYWVKNGNTLYPKDPALANLALGENSTNGARLSLSASGVGIGVPGSSLLRFHGISNWEIIRDTNNSLMLKTDSPTSQGFSFANEGGSKILDIRNQGRQVIVGGQLGVNTVDTNYAATIKSGDAKTLLLTSGAGAIGDSAGLVVGGRAAFNYDGLAQQVVISDNGSTKDIVFKSGVADTVNYVGIERMRIKSNGNVGIGDINPINKLDVSGNIGISARNSLNFGATNESASIKINPNVLGDESGLVISGVGINGDSESLFRLVSINSILSTGSLCDMYNRAGCKTVAEILNAVLPKSPQKDFVLVAKDTNGNVEWRATSTVGFSGGSSNWLVNGNNISNKNSGNVGIGVANPQAKLEVGGPIIAGIQGGTSNISFRRNSDGFNTASYGYAQGSSGDVAAINSGGGGIFTWLTNVGGTVAERMRLTNDGKLGLGTNDPQNDLEVVNNQSGTTGVNVLNNNSGSAAIAQVGASNNTGYGSALRIITTGPNVSAGVLTGGQNGEADPAFTPDTAILRSGGALSGGLIISSSNGAKEGSISRGTKAGSIQFHTRSDDGTVYQSGFSKEGSLGIGTTNAASKLHVVGSILATPKSDGTGGILSGKNLILTGGAGDGKVLVSDANGLASWADSVSVGKTYGAGLNRGLELVGANNNLFAIKEGGVDTTEIKDGSILSLDLAGNSVDGSKIIDSSITAVDLAAGSVGNEEITANAIGTGKIMAGGVMTDDIADANVTAAKLASMGATNGQFLQWNGSTWTPTSLPSATAYTASPTGGLSLTNNAFAIKAKGVLASMLDQMGATTGQVLSWNGTTWAPTSLNVTANSILPTATANQTIRFNGTNWVTNGNGLLTNGVKVSIGTGNLASTKNLHVAGGIATDDLVVTGNYVQSSKGKVLTDPAGNGEVFWESPVTTARFSKGSGSTFTRVAGSGSISWSVQEGSGLGARDFVTMTCPAEREAIGGGAVCIAGQDLTSSGPGASIRDWRISCGNRLADIQTITVTCARAN